MTLKEQNPLRSFFMPETLQQSHLHANKISVLLSFCNLKIIINFAPKVINDFAP